jgi:Family of unknown function (DUF5677)
VDVRAVIVSQLGPPLAACERLREFSLGMTEPWGGRPLGEDPLVDTLIVSLFTRSYGTYSASLALLREGHGPQGAMLNRSLYEDMVDAHWIATEPEQAGRLMRDHYTHAQMLLADVAAKYPSFFGKLELPDFDAEERKRLDQLFGEHGHRPWARIGLHARAQAIEHFWEDSPEGLETLRFYRDIVHRENNLTLHVTALGLASGLRGRDDTGLVLTMGPGLEMVDRALLGAFWTFGQTVGLVLDRFEFEVDEDERAGLFNASPFMNRDLSA